MDNRPTYKDVVGRLELKVSEAAQQVQLVNADETGPKNTPLGLRRSTKVVNRRSVSSSNFSKDRAESYKKKSYQDKSHPVTKESVIVDSKDSNWMELCKLDEPQALILEEHEKRPHEKDGFFDKFVGNKYVDKIVKEMKEDQDEKYEKIETKFKNMVESLSGFIKIADV